MTLAFVSPEDLSAADLRQISDLFRQLNPELPQQDVPALLASPNPPLLVVCRDGEKILGMGTLCLYTVISGRKAWIEDVVVDTAARGSGLGRRIMEALIGRAREAGAREVLLFTGHHREAAHRLYLSLGFAEKQSRLMRLALD